MLKHAVRKKEGMHLNALFKKKNLKYGYKLRWRLPARSTWCNVNHCDMEKGTCSFWKIDWWRNAV